ncbi:MAG: hypothetical protein ABL949_17085 [Fimbriimonadaceae bacterium]
MKNRFLALIPVAMLAVFVMTGCSGGGEAADTSAGPVPKTDPNKPPSNENAAAAKPADTL